MSFVDATLVWSIGETVEEVGRESAFLKQAPTLACAALANGAGTVQVNLAGVILISQGKAKQWDFLEWSELNDAHLQMKVK